MRRTWPGLVAFPFVAVLSACSCGGNGATDAATPDAGPPDSAGMRGVWRVVEDRGGGNPVTHTGPDRVNGTLELTSDRVAHATVEITGDRLAPDYVEGFVSTYAVSANGMELEIDGVGALSFAFSSNPERIVLDDKTFDRLDHEAQEMLSVSGVVSFSDDGSQPFVPLATARVGLVFLLRNSGGQPDFIQVPGGDVPLAGFGGDVAQTATFDLSRTEGALGVERITFGTAFASLGFVIVYDDTNANDRLDQLWETCGAGQDCIRGVSPILVAYRVGQSPEIDASPFAFLREAWTFALPSRDHRSGTPSLGAVSLDRSTTEPVPYDVVLPREPGHVVIPPFVL